MRGLIEDGAAEMHMRARVFAGIPRPAKVAQIERNPRQGVELVLPHYPGAPDTVGGFLKLLVCDALVVGLVAAAGLWWLR